MLVLVGCWPVNSKTIESSNGLCLILSMAGFLFFPSTFLLSLKHTGVPFFKHTATPNRGAFFQSKSELWAFGGQKLLEQMLDLVVQTFEDANWCVSRFWPYPFVVPSRFWIRNQPPGIGEDGIS